MEVREASDRDLPALVEANNLLAPAVNALPPDEFSRLVGLSVWTRVIGPIGEPTAALLALEGPGLDYPSENYAWFSARHDRFLYVDRVFVVPTAQVTGLGGMLYRSLISWGAGEGYRVLCAEVNLEPPNPGSLRFHAEHDFRAVGEQSTKGGSVKVRMLERSLPR
jgi:predicted GNAT superfamily acetyltransferase